MSRTAFDVTYDELRARWPDSTDERDIDTPYGRTRVHVYGPADGEGARAALTRG